MLSRGRALSTEMFILIHIKIGFYGLWLFNGTSVAEAKENQIKREVCLLGGYTKHKPKG